MTATSKLESLSAGPSVSGFGPHVEELHAFFRTRGMGFGSAEDLKPFVDRLDSDAGFADEIASVVRTIIYQERDGLSRLELIELIETAVGGPRVEDETGPEVREAVRRLMVFVEGVFRTRRNPGGVSVEGGDPTSVPKVVAPAQAEHSKIDMFYRAQMVAHDEGEEIFVEARTVESTVKHEVAREGVGAEAVLHPGLHWHIPLEDFDERETGERGSPVWLWLAGICALMLAFCAGLVVHQRLLVPLRAPNTPYEAPPPEAKQWPTVSAPAPASAAKPAKPSAAASSSTRPARAETAETSSALRSEPVARPAAVPVNEVTQLPKYMAPATIGASAAVMQAHLVYAPPAGYPMMAEMTRTQGKVVVEEVVGKNGRVIRAQAISGHHLLRGAAVREVYARRYRPYLVNGRPVNVATLVTIDFRLRR